MSSHHGSNILSSWRAISLAKSSRLVPALRDLKLVTGLSARPWAWMSEVISPPRGLFRSTPLSANLACPIPDSLTYEAACVLPLGLSTASCGLFMKDYLALRYPTNAPLPRNSNQNTVSKKRPFSSGVVLRAWAAMPFSWRQLRDTMSSQPPHHTFTAISRSSALLRYMTTKAQQ
jgi:hypothetical protein